MPNWKTEQRAEYWGVLQQGKGHMQWLLLRKLHVFLMSEKVPMWKQSCKKPDPEGCSCPMALSGDAFVFCAIHTYSVLLEDHEAELWTWRAFPCALPAAWSEFCNLITVLLQWNHSMPWWLCDTQWHLMVWTASEMSLWPPLHRLGGVHHSLWVWKENINRYHLIFRKISFFLLWVQNSNGSVCYPIPGKRVYTCLVLFSF